MLSAPTHRSLVEALLENAEDRTRGFAFVGDNGDESFLSFADLKDAAAKGGAALVANGVRPGDRVALIAPDNREFVTSFLAAVWIGAVPVPLYPPAGLGKLDVYTEFIESVLVASEAGCLVAPKWLGQALGLADRFGARLALVPAEELLAAEGLAEPEPRTPEQAVFLQFTSGSTGKPKGVVVTDASLWANGKTIFVSGLRATDEDHVVSWLPLYHDMGLISKVLSPLLFGLSATLIPTLAFLRNPGVWLDAISRKRGTFSFAPNFAFALTAKKAKAPTEGWDLSSMRLLGCGAEPINGAVLDSFIEAFEPHGLRPEAVTAGYGMAEATLAISFGTVDGRFDRLAVARAAYQEEGRAVPAAEDEPSLSFVSCGRALDSEHAVRVVDDEDRELPEGQVGDVQFRGPSVAAGYFGNPEATEAAFLADGWLRTGDRGFVFDGELYVTGRKKDVLVVNGRNYDPMQVEWAVEEVDGVRKGNVVAFSVLGEATEQVVVALERSAERDGQTTEIRRAVSDRTRLSLADIVLLNPGQLPKTSSGKVQRSRTRELYLRGELADSVVATRTHAHAEPARI